MRIVNTTTHYGTYGSQFHVDENGDPIEDQKIKREKRKTIGRPKKNEISEGSHFVVNDYFYRWAMMLHFLKPPIH